jgi:hypothetical protein
VEEGEDVFGGHGAGGFEFAALLAEEEGAIGIENGDGGDTVVERDFVFFGDVEILVHLADVDMDDEEGFVEGGGDFGAMEGFVENVTIEAPVAAEDDEDAFVGRCSGVEGFCDLRSGIGGRVVDFLSFEGLAEAGGAGALDDYKRPLIAVMEPGLHEGDELLLGGCALFQGEGELESEDVKTGLGIAFLDEVGGEIGQAFGFPGGPEGEFVREGDGLVAEGGNAGFGKRGIEAGEGGRVTGKHGGAPLVEGRKGKRAGGLRDGSGGERGCKEEK